jgi:hypothetical protein
MSDVRGIRVADLTMQNGFASARVKLALVSSLSLTTTSLASGASCPPTITETV